MSVAALTACGGGDDKKGDGGGGGGANPQGEKPNPVTAYVEVEAEITEDTVKTLEKKETTEKDGDLSCTVLLKPGQFKYEVSGNTLAVENDEGESSELEREKGNSGDLEGEWFAGESTDNGINFRATMVFKENRVGLRLTCSLAE